MITHGIVQTKQDGFSKVRIGKKAGCEGCNQCGKMRDSLITAKDDTDAKVGDSVELQISDKKYGQSILFLYVCPLVGFVIGLLVGYYGISAFFDPKSVDMVSMLCGIIIMLITYLIIWLFRKKIDKRPVAVVIATIEDVENV